MRIHYVYHSGFVAECEKCIIIFDYYRHELPACVQDAIDTQSKDVFFFASHTHSDHFNPDIFKYYSDNVYYIISDDIKDKILHRSMLDDYDGIMYEFIHSDQCMTINGKCGSEITVETLKSTDRGVAFIVTADGQCLYHAGDHNDWAFEEADKSKNNDVKARYERELQKIKGRHFDAAFLPVDYRLGKYYCRGPIKFLELTDTKYIFPMHMWKEYGYIDKFRNEEAMSDYRDRVLDVDADGKFWDI